MKVTGIALWLPTFPASGKSYQKKNKLIRLDGATRQKGHFLIPYTKKETRHDKTQTNLTTYTERKEKMRRKETRVIFLSLFVSTTQRERDRDRETERDREKLRDKNVDDKKCLRRNGKTGKGGGGCRWRKREDPYKINPREGMRNTTNKPWDSIVPLKSASGRKKKTNVCL